MPDSLKLKPYRGKKTTAELADIVLEKGEFFIESPETGVGTGAGRIKIGDGVTAYSSLPYFYDYNDFIKAILDASGTEVAHEDTMQFSGYLKTTDDSTNNKTVVSDAPTEIDWDDWKDLTTEQKQGKKWMIVNAPDGGIDGNVITLKNQTLDFVNNVATISYSYITENTRVFVFYNDNSISVAADANITITTSDGAITFTAENTPTSDITCDITILGIMSEISNFVTQQNVIFTYTENGWRSSTYQTNKRIVRAVSGDYLITGDGTAYCRIYQDSGSGLTAISTASSPITIPCLTVNV